MSIYQRAPMFDNLTPVVKRILLVNVTLFFISMILPPNFVDIFGLRPEYVLHRLWMWQLITYSFIHLGGWHLFFNMFSLWMFGPSIESQWGSRRFLLYYLLCGVGAGLTQMLVAPEILVVGASGAIYGLLLAFGFLAPDAVIQLFFVFPVRALQAVFFIALITLASAVGSGGSRIAHFAHLGGMLTGFLYFKLPQWFAGFRYFRFSSPFRRRGPKLHVIRPDDLSDEVDRILEKISSQGLDSLTSAEHETMRKYAKRKE